MTATRAQLLTIARQHADAVASTRWTDDEVRRALGVAHDLEWSRILAAAPMTRAATRTVASDASGQVAFSALNGGAGDSAEVFYRVLAWRSGTDLYRQITFREVPLEAAQGAGCLRAYYPFGSAFQVLPAESGASYTVAVNHKPTNAYDLSADTATVEFPANAELLLGVVTAQVMLRSKGGAEAQGALSLEGTATLLRESMLDDLARRSGGPLVMGFADDAADWEG